MNEFIPHKAYSRRMSFWHIESDTTTLGFDRASEEVALANWLCQGCKRVRVGARIEDVRIDESRVRGPLEWIGGAGLVVASTEFLDALGYHEVRKSFSLFPVEDCRGRVMNDYRVLHSETTLIVRGSTYVSWRRCDECNRIAYSSTGTYYLCPRPAEEDRLHISDLYGIVMPDSVYQKVGWGRWPTVKRSELPVLETPLDGLPEFLE